MLRLGVSVRRPAFTLNEILVVLATLTFFAAFVLPLSGCSGGSASGMDASPRTAQTTVNTSNSLDSNSVAAVSNGSAALPIAVQNTDADLSASGTQVAAASSGSSRAPAPPLSYLEVYAVASEKVPSYEYPSQYQMITNADHSGKWLIVVTKEMGYSNSQIAKFAGSRMSLVREDRILSGNIIVGYYRYWQYNGNFTSGVFEYQATSMVLPYTTKYDRITVK